MDTSIACWWRPAVRRPRWAHPIRQASRRARPQDTLVLPYNDPAALEAAFNKHGPQIAAVIVEPIVGNMGCVPACDDFRLALRRLTRQHGGFLILDEVMTGFRVAYGGAQSLADWSPT